MIGKGDKHIGRTVPSRAAHLQMQSLQQTGQQAREPTRIHGVEQQHGPANAVRKQRKRSGCSTPRRAALTPQRRSGRGGLGAGRRAAPTAASTLLPVRLRNHGRRHGCRCRPAPTSAARRGVPEGGLQPLVTGSWG